MEGRMNEGENKKRLERKEGRKKQNKSKKESTQDWNKEVRTPEEKK